MVRLTCAGDGVLTGMCWRGVWPTGFGSGSSSGGPSTIGSSGVVKGRVFRLSIKEGALGTTRGKRSNSMHGDSQGRAFGATTTVGSSRTTTRGTWEATKDTNICGDALMSSIRIKTVVSPVGRATVTAIGRPSRSTVTGVSGVACAMPNIASSQSLKRPVSVVMCVVLDELVPTYPMKASRA